MKYAHILAQIKAATKAIPLAQDATKVVKVSEVSSQNMPIPNHTDISSASSTIQDAESNMQDAESLGASMLSLFGQG